MRKRILIGTIAAVVVGVAAYFLSQPRNGSVEYHKKEYLKAFNALSSRGWVDASFVPGMVRRFRDSRRSLRLDFHQRALLDAGYLTEGVFAVSNSSPLLVWREAVPGLAGVLPKDDWNFSLIQQTNTNVLRVIAPREWFDKIGQAIRQADVPVAPREWSDKIGVTIRKADVPETK